MQSRLASGIIGKQRREEMKMLNAVLDAVLMFVAVILILLTLLQGGKSEGISGAFTGSSGLGLLQNAKERGPEKFIANFTLMIGSIFFILVIVIRVLN